MFARAAFVFIAAFWLLMNVLLWRAEFGQRREAGSVVPVETVWKKMQTAPDDSTLGIFRAGTRIGYCRWATSVSRDLARLDDAAPADVLARLTEFKVFLDGSVSVRDAGFKIHFGATLTVSTNGEWRELEMRAQSAPVVWQLRASAAEETVGVLATDGGEKFGREFKFSELRNPQALLGELAGLKLPGILGALGEMDLPGPATAQDVKPLSSGIRWEARTDTLKIGHESVRVYRLQARLLDRYDFRIFVSRVGEILRAEFPDNIVFEQESIVETRERAK